MLRTFLALTGCIFFAAPGFGSGAGDAGDLDTTLARLARDHPDLVSPSRIGLSREGRPLHLLRLGAAGQGEPDTRPALLIVAGIHGLHHAGTEVAIGVARSLVSDRAELLGEHTVYIVPRLDPDGFAAGRDGTSRPDDADRDGRVDEDGPVDLDGDGAVVTMRVPDPPPGIPRTHLPDPDHPRLLKKADPAKGERPRYALLPEGIDHDGDGAYGEDGPGGVDLDRNFPHQWREHSDGAGPYPLSEPESEALVRWMLRRPNIAAVLVFGPHDTLVKLPESGKYDRTKKAPLGLEKEDRPYHEEVARIFKEITGMTAAPEVDPAGSFQAWAYAQFGVPAFSTPVWVRPDLVEHPKEGESEARTEKPPGPDDDPAWLRYSDEQRHGAGFVDWKPFEHPTLGRVEIGGFVAGFRLDPPPEEVPRLIAEQAAFTERLLGLLPRLEIEDPLVERLAPGVWRVVVRVRNDGFFPTVNAIGVKVRRTTPLRLVMDHPRDRILAGSPLVRHASVAGSGGTAEGEWILAAEEGATVGVEVRSTLFGNRRLQVRLERKEGS